MPRHDTNAVPRTHQQRFSWSKQVEIDVVPTTALQPDRLAQKELFDEHTRPHVPDCNSISLEIHNGKLYDYYPAKKYHFDGMLGPNVPTEVRAALWQPVMTIPGYASRLRNLCHEAAADFPAMEELLLQRARERWAVLLPVHNLCTLLGLANSHDTTVVVLQSVLEEHEEALQNNLRHLWEQKYVTSNRKNQSRPRAKDQQPMVKLGENICQVLRKFSGYELKGTQDGPQPGKSQSNQEGGKRRYTWQLKLCQNWPLIPDIIKAITLQAELPDTANANVNLTGAQDAAAKDSESDVEVGIEVESIDSEDDYEEQTLSGNKFKTIRVNT